MVPEAVLLVGGKGTRLRPLTVGTPKPMLPTAGVPFLHHVLAKARAAGVEHVVLATSYRPEVFQEGLGDGSALGLRVDYVTEEEPLGTGGGIRNVAGLLEGGAGRPGRRSSTATSCRGTTSRGRSRCTSRPAPT